MNSDWTDKQIHCADKCFSLIFTGVFSSGMDGGFVDVFGPVRGRNWSPAPITRQWIGERHEFEGLSNGRLPLQFAPGVSLFHVRRVGCQSSCSHFQVGIRRSRRNINQSSRNIVNHSSSLFTFICTLLHGQLWGFISFSWKIIIILYCPAVFGHSSPAPVKTDRAVRIQ